MHHTPLEIPNTFLILTLAIRSPRIAHRPIRRAVPVLVMVAVRIRDNDIPVLVAELLSGYALRLGVGLRAALGSHSRGERTDGKVGDIDVVAVVVAHLMSVSISGGEKSGED